MRKKGKTNACESRRERGSEFHNRLIIIFLNGILMFDEDLFIQLKRGKIAQKCISSESPAILNGYSYVYFLRIFFNKHHLEG